MQAFKQKFRAIIVGYLTSMVISMPVIAEDIEIYTSLGASVATIQPNLLFILDTSGSMNTDITTSQGTYDATFTYAGCYTTNRIYWSTSGSTPSCTTGRWFTKSLLQCDHADKSYDSATNLPLVDGFGVPLPGPLETAGYYVDQIARFNNGHNDWHSLSTNTFVKTNHIVECAQDKGIHGHNTVNTTARTYIRNTSGGYRAAAYNHPVWNNGSNNKTLFDFNYLNYLVDPAFSTTESRFVAMQKAVLALVDANSNVNIGLMRFDGQGQSGNDTTNPYDGGPVVYAMEDINAARNDYKARVNTMTAGGFTPLAETYYEALMYYGGKSVQFGDTSDPLSDVDNVAPVTLDPSDTSKYLTPIVAACQKNHIIYLTDGSPNEDDKIPGLKSTLPGFSSGCSSANGATNSCLDELAGWANSNDIATLAIPEHDGEQNIVTHTIGFGFGAAATTATSTTLKLLDDTATAGGGVFKQADSANELTAAFNEIIAGLLEENATFSSPAVSVNAFNRATHLNDLYFTLFKPRKGGHWDGNLKKYKLLFGPDVSDVDGDGDVTETIPIITDSVGAAAIDNVTGFFADIAQSFWSAAVDGPEAAAGGAASNFTTSRRVYTLTGTYTNSSGVSTPSNGALTASVNAVLKTNALLTDALLGTTGFPDHVTGTPYRETLIDWMRGIDVDDVDEDNDTTDARLVMGDPLHAEPGLVQYGVLGTDSDGDGIDDPDLVAYVGTNDGYLHAINSITGAEYFSFIPQEQLLNMNNVFEATSALGKFYGIDGNIVPWINDIDKDGIIEAGENVYLYFGQRRGGRDIYSMDVTDRNNPVIRWVIKGGVGDYAELGDTWSTVNVEKIKMGGLDRTVLIFGGGYDTGQDNVTVRSLDSVGRGVFIVDALTGALLWRAGPDVSADLRMTNMQYSIPARVKPIDIDGDGYIDRLFTGDMGGQLWRFDIDNDASTVSSVSVSGARIADFAVDTSVADNRRFYYPPDVALIVEEGQAPYISILASSGYRAHPLTVDTHDRIYMLRDNNIYNTPTPFPPVLTEADLFDTTDNAVGEGTGATQTTAITNLGAADGWFIKLNELDSSWIGEKGLSEPLILDGVAIFTTFIPDNLGVVVASCTPKAGTGAVFFLNVTDGTPTYDISGNNTRTREDRRTFVKRGGIPPSPNVIISSGGDPTLCIGTECTDARIGSGLKKTYWYEVEQ